MNIVLCAAGDKRLDLLEKAMALANHGQGVGFRAPIAGVINKKVLGGIAVKVAVSLLTAVVTMVRPQKTFCTEKSIFCAKTFFCFQQAMSFSKYGTIETRSAAVNSTGCALSSTQVTVIQSLLDDDLCAASNVTIVEILSGEILG